MQHPNARLTPRGRLELVLLVERGASLRFAAGACNVALSTAHRWVVRWRAATTAERASLACLLDRSSRPHVSPRLLAADVQQRVVEARSQTGWGPRLLAGALGLAHQTVWKVLHRHGCSRPPRALREAANRYEWPCPGDLLHMDVCRYARFERPGHAVTGDRRKTSVEKLRGVGYDFAHAIVDDHTRLAYVELLADERAQTVTGFVERSLDYFARSGITASRLLTDNAFTYTKHRSLRELLEAREISHRTTRPYRPQTNGKVERFHQTMAREWAYGMTYRSSSARAAALPHWTRHYNEQRPHSSLANRPPISRVHNLRGQDS
jgi:transposase InsO family protein